MSFEKKCEEVPGGARVSIINVARKDVY